MKRGLLPESRIQKKPEVNESTISGSKRKPEDRDGSDRPPQRLMKIHQEAEVDLLERAIAAAWHGTSPGFRRCATGR